MNTLFYEHFILWTHFWLIVSIKKLGIMRFQESEQSRLSFAGSFISTPLFRRAHAAIKVYEVPLIGRYLPLNYVVYCQGKSEDAEPVSSDTKFILCSCAEFHVFLFSITGIFEIEGCILVNIYDLSCKCRKD